MSEFGSENFNRLMEELVKKSLFTEQQIGIIMRRQRGLGAKPGVSRGAYYHQVGQTREKLVRFYHTLILLYSMEVVTDGGVETAKRVAGQVSMVGQGDVVGGVDEVVGVIDRLARQTCRL